MKSIRLRYVFLYYLLLAIVVVPISQANLYAETDPFPLYPSIEPNVEFWKKIYSVYSIKEGVIHDKTKLDIIYGVIDLKHPDLRGSRKINRDRIKKAKKTYKAILRKLSQGAAPSGPEEERIAELFGPDAGREDFKKASRNLRCQVGLKERFREGVIISGAYLEEIQNIFNNYGLPVDLAYLPHVESSFNLKAYSKFGAAGIWQFTRSTGKQYMKVGYTVDERRDPIIASYAAAKLLNRNYSKFNNWPMAITAYNHGATGMRRAQRARGSYEEIFKKYRNRTFKFASRNFYSEFLAAREIAKDYRQYFGELQLDTPLETAVVELAGYVSLPELARHLDTDLEVIRALNPALRRPVYTGQKYVPKGYRLRLPAETDRSWESLIAELTTDIYKGKQKHSRFYTARRGDTAGAIARRHGVELEDLIAANNLNSRATIYVNQTLRIPVAGEEIVKPKTSQPVEKPKEPVVEPSRMLAANQPTPIPPASPVEAPVVREEEPSTPTDSKVVAQTPIAQEQIDLDRNLNRISSLATSAIFENLTVERVQELKGMTVGYIRVEVEETLGHYAEWLDVTARDIRRLNGFRYGRMIHLDQRIKVPLHRVTKEEFEEKRIEYHQELAEDFFETYRVEDVQTYIVKRGDNVWSLAKEEFEVPMWLIKRYNINVNFNELMPSQELRVPVTVKIIG